MEKLHGWVFTYNSLNKRWLAVKREDYHLMFSNISSPKVLSSNSKDTLIEIIIKTDGQPSKVKKLLKNGK